MKRFKEQREWKEMLKDGGSLVAHYLSHSHTLIHTRTVGHRTLRVADKCLVTAVGPGGPVKLDRG